MMPCWPHHSAAQSTLPDAVRWRLRADGHSCRDWQDRGAPHRPRPEADRLSPRDTQDEGARWRRREPAAARKTSVDPEQSGQPAAVGRWRSRGLRPWTLQILA
jgi:hypothetical protein